MITKSLPTVKKPFQELKALSKVKTLSERLIHFLTLLKKKLKDTTF